MEFRKATEQDYDAIVQLIPSEEELFLVYPKGKHPFTVEQLRSLAETRKELTLVIDGGEVIGFANLYDVQPGQWAFIGNVVVSKTLRGRGIGRALVVHMIRQAFALYDVKEVRISVFNHNTPALLLYRDLNFEPYAIDERTSPSGSRAGLIHMRLLRGEVDLL
jgi:ribosomal protein S18 acetylase RimI-like enzyme